jgi:hypothetical protein
MKNRPTQQDNRQKNRQRQVCFGALRAGIFFILIALLPKLEGTRPSLFSLLFWRVLPIHCEMCEVP